jgi:exopolyphosphatase
VIYESHAAKLALAAILVDTANLAAEGRVSSIDREALSFLEDKIRQGVIAYRRLDPKVEWDRLSFYEEIMQAKRSSVENLTIEEILGRDYKEWTEPANPDTAGRAAKIGICNIVRPLCWLLSKAEIKHAADGKTDEPFFSHLRRFALVRQLDVVAVMTVFTSQLEGEFCRELVVWVLNEDHVPGAELFEVVATNQLGLVDWTGDGDPHIQPSCGPNNDSPACVGWRRIWRQTDVTKSRKAVAPLLRKAMAGK